MRKSQDLTGNRYGDLTAICRNSKRGNGKSPVVHWECLCKCGNLTVVASGSLKNGHIKSCGCGNEKNKFSVKHGMSHSREYRAWSGMKGRCKNADGQHKTYVEKGISVCKEWVNDFAQFYKDMGPIVDPCNTLERIENDKGYSKENCKWATQAEQNLNYSQNRLVTYQGETMTVTAWSKKLGLSRHRIYQRLNKGWDISRVMSTKTETNGISTLDANSPLEVLS